MDWQLCLKPASIRPQDLCELNVNAALKMLCKSIERTDGWLRESDKKGEGKQGVKRTMEGQKNHNERLHLFPLRLCFSE